MTWKTLRSRHPKVARAIEAALAVPTALALHSAAAPPVLADCSDNGSTATCSGMDTDGYLTPAGVTRVNVNAAASVSNVDVPAMPAIEVIEVDTRVTTSATATITATGDDSVGILGVDELDLRWSAGNISAEGNRARGVVGGDTSTVANVGVIRAGKVDLSEMDTIGVDLGLNGTLCNGPVSGGKFGCFDDSGASQGSTISAEGPNAIAVRMGAGGDVLNLGTIRAEGSDAVGIETVEDFVLENDPGALIDVVGTGSTGVQAGDRADVKNRGTISSNGQGSVALSLGNDAVIVNEKQGAITSEQDDSIAVRVGSGATLSNIDNARIEAQGANSVAVSAGSGADVTNESEIRAGDSGGIAFEFRGDGTLTNRGTIAGGSGAGAGVLFSDSGSASLVNQSNGVIRSAGGVAIIGGTAPDSIENRGRIAGDVSLGDGADSLRIYGGSTITGIADGGGGADRIRVEGGGNGSLDLDRFQDFETLDLSGGGRWTLRGSTNLSGGTTLSNGTLDVDGVVALGGAYTQQSGTVLRMEIDPAGGGDRLDVTGTATLNGGSLEVTSSGPVADGSRFILIDADAIAGSFSQEPTGTAVLDLKVFTNGQDLGVRVSRRSYADLGDSSNQRDLGRYLDRLVPGATGDLADVLGTLDFLDPADFSDALDSMNVEYYDAQTHTALAMGRAFNDLLLDTPRVCDARFRRRDERSSATTDCVEREAAPWLATWGLFGSRDPGSGHIEYHNDGGGFSLGQNLRIHERVGIAGAIGAGRSAVDVKSQGDGSLTTVSVGVRAVAEVGPVALRSALSYQHGWHDVRRQMNIPGIARTADGTYDSDQVNAALEVLAPLELAAFHIEPYVGVDVGWVHEEGFDEDGAGALRLSVDSRDTTQVAASAGVRVHTIWEPDAAWDDVYSLSRAVFVPELRAGYRRVFTDVDRDLDASFVGAPSGTGGFEAEGDDTPQLVELGAGITMQPRGGMSVGLHYDIGLGDDTVIHQARLLFRVPLSLALASD